MGKNILCILSSPRQNSNSGLLAEAVLEGAAEHGGKAEVIRLVERNINPCHGCFACTRSDRGCVQHDGMTDLYPLIASAVPPLFPPGTASSGGHFAAAGYHPPPRIT